MLTVKFIRNGSAQWEIICCDSFKISQKPNSAIISLENKSYGSKVYYLKTNDSPDDDCVDSYNACYVENLSGKTIFKWDNGKG